jgi:hypothetical protein
MRQSSLHVANSFGSKAANLLAQKLWQPRKVRRDPPRFVLGEQFGRRAATGLVFVVDVCQPLPITVSDDVIG